MSLMGPLLWASPSRIIRALERRLPSNQLRRADRKEVELAERFAAVPSIEMVRL